MEKYSKAVREVHLQFEKRESHPAEKYIGRLVRCSGGQSFRSGRVHQILGQPIQFDSRRDFVRRLV